MERVSHRDCTRQHSPGKKWLTCPQQRRRLSAQALGWDPRGKDRHWLSWRYSEGTSNTQLREYREKPGPTIEAETTATGNALTLHGECRTSPSQCRRWDKPATVWDPRRRKAGVNAKGRTGEYYSFNSRGHSCHHAVSEHGSLTIPSWEPEQLGSTEGPRAPGASPTRVHNPPQTSGISCRLPVWRATLHTPQLCLPYPLSPNSRWWASISCYFLPPLLSGQEQTPEGSLQADRARTKWRHQELCEQRRKGKSLLWRRCNGLNPHNKPETVNSRGNCGFGKQV